MNKKILKYLFVALLLVTVSEAYSQKTIRILSIGNSFSKDAAESYVDDLAKADGVKLIIANIHIGGCDLEHHWINAKNDSANYSYRKIVNGDTIKMSNKSLAFAISDEPWDYISFQQASLNSGKFNTYFPYLSDLINYAKNITSNRNVRFCMHQTWAYAGNSKHYGYEYYQKNQMVMYDSIVTAINKAASRVGINIIIPAGTAIQNGRSSYIGDNFNRDGHHLSLNLGRYTAACAWYEKLSGKNVIGNTFAPSELSPKEIEIAQRAAHFAVLRPDKVTAMSDIQTPNTRVKSGSSVTH